MCAGCPVFDPCQQWSLALPVTDRTIYAGMSTTERLRSKRDARLEFAKQAIRAIRQLRSARAPGPASAPACRDIAGYPLKHHGGYQKPEHSGFCLLRAPLARDVQSQAPAGL